MAAGAAGLVYIRVKEGGAIEAAKPVMEGLSAEQRAALVASMQVSRACRLDRSIQSLHAAPRREVRRRPCSPPAALATRAPSPTAPPPSGVAASPPPCWTPLRLRSREASHFRFQPCPPALCSPLHSKGLPLPHPSPCRRSRETCCWLRRGLSAPSTRRWTACGSTSEKIWG